MSENERRPGSAKRQILHGTNLAIYIVVVLAIIVLCNWFVNRNDHHLDLTPNKEFSLSPDSQAFEGFGSSGLDLCVRARKRLPGAPGPDEPLLLRFPLCPCSICRSQPDSGAGERIRSAELGID